MLILLSSNKEILKNYIKPNGKVGFVATASELENNREFVGKDRRELIDIGFELIDFDITNEDKTKILEKLNYIDALFVAGGNAFYLLQQLYMKDILIDLINFARKKIYVGSSAGACIACPSIDYLEKLDNKSNAPFLKNCYSMNLIDAYILPHYNSKDKYTKLADEIEKEYFKYKFIKLSNAQAIIVDDLGRYVVIETN